MNEIIKMHDKVEIIKTKEIAFVVWFDESNPNTDSFMLEIDGKNEMPDFYQRKDFRKV